MNDEIIPFQTDFKTTSKYVIRSLEVFPPTIFNHHGEQ